MFGRLSLIATIALVPFVAAQNVDNIKAHFTGAQIVPNYFPTFDPIATLSLTYEGTTLTPGQAVAKEPVNSAPVVTVTPANSSVTLAGPYTLAMIDLDRVGGDISEGVNRHWLLNGVTVAEGGVVSNETAAVVTRYWGPWPAEGSGPHRYVVALFQQPADFAAPAAFPGGDTLGVEPMDFTAYVTSANLGPIVAANYINVEEGTATVSLVATSAPAAATTPAAGSGTSKPSGSSTGSAAGTSATSGALQLVASPIAALVAGFFAFAL